MREKDKFENKMRAAPDLPSMNPGVQGVERASEIVSAARQELCDRLAQLWLQGVRHFPVETKQPPATKPVGPAQCRACPVCTDERHAFWQELQSASEVRSEAKRASFMVVIDQPFSGTTLNQDLEDKSSPNNLILRLLERAGLKAKTHIVYALRSIPVQMPSSAMVKTCAEVWLRQELATLQPQCVFCFGSRAKAALEYALGSGETLQIEGSNGASHEHSALAGSAGSSDQMKCVWRGFQFHVKYFPSPLELHQYPGWRQAVWAQVTEAAKSFA